ncbi:MAG: hypothetical protein HND52_07155 [Ignavibacteriae bacterium]|nr:hypothetical protein [Ignavibacteriota bacterium]NOG97722.1 hypothetical protein [Ignavibacteriota bacterium]
MELYYDENLAAQILLNEVLKELKLSGKTEEIVKNSNIERILRKLNRIIKRRYSVVKQGVLKKNIFSILRNDYGIQF